MEISGATNLIGTTLSSSFTRPITFRRRHHSPPYSIICDFLGGLLLNDIFSQDSQNWDFYCPKTLNVHIFFKSTFLEHAKVISYNPQKDLSNNVLHAPIGDHLTFALKGFMVENQISNLILGPSFDHNSCISGLNEQCEGILNIYTSKSSNCIMGAQFGVCLPFQLRF